MTLEEEFRLLVSGYYGVSEIDEYTSKYMFKGYRRLYSQFYTTLSNTNRLLQIADELEKLPLKTKLQDALLILPKVKGSMELTLLIRARLNEMKSSKFLNYKKYS